MKKVWRGNWGICATDDLHIDNILFACWFTLYNALFMGVFNVFPDCAQTRMDSQIYIVA
jgi:hypothetical protein